MRQITPALLIAATLILAGSMSGCVKLRQVVTLMPDGSGKIELRFGLSEAMVQFAQENEGDPFSEVLPEAMAEQTRGIVAFTPPVREKIGTYSFLTYSVYFNDINQVRVEGLGEGEPAEYQYTRDGGSATLTVRHGTMLSAVQDIEPTPDEEREEMRRAMEGLELSEHYALPGEFEGVPGVTAVDNTAKIDLTLDHLLDASGPVEDLQGKDSIRFAITRLTVTDEQAQAFRQEMEVAVAAWRAEQQEAE